MLDSIVNFDPRIITKNVRTELQNYITQHSNSFEKAVIYRASQAAGPLADWVLAVLKYSEVFEQVRPLQEKLFKVEVALQAQK